MRTPLVLLCLSAVPATAQMVPGTIASNNAEFSFLGYPSTNTGAEGRTTFRCAGQLSTNHLFHTWWYWRMDNDQREFAFHNNTATQAPPMSVFAGTTATLTWPNVDNRGIEARLELRVYAPGPTSAMCIQQMTITNNTGNGITLNLFGYNDFDLCGAFANNAAATRPNLHTVSDPACSTSGQAFGPNASRYEIASFPAVRARLLDSATDTLANSGLPYGPGDYSGAFQWQDVAVGPGASYTAYMVLTLDFPHSGCARRAGATTYGAAKQGSNGLPAWNINHRPMIGLPVTLQILNGVAGSFPQLYVGPATANLYYAPFDVTLLVDVGQPYISFFGGTFDASGRSTTSFLLPNVATLCNLTLHAQAIYVDPGATRGVGQTDGLAWTPGGVF